MALPVGAATAMVVNGFWPALTPALPLSTTIIGMAILAGLDRNGPRRRSRLLLGWIQDPRSAALANAFADTQIVRLRYIPLTPETLTKAGVDDPTVLCHAIRK